MKQLPIETWKPRRRTLTEMRRLGHLPPFSLRETPPPMPPALPQWKVSWRYTPGVPVRPNGFWNRQRSLFFMGCFSGDIWFPSEEFKRPHSTTSELLLANFDVNAVFVIAPRRLCLSQTMTQLNGVRDSIQFSVKKRQKLSSPTLSTISFIEVRCVVYKRSWQVFFFFILQQYL